MEAHGTKISLVSEVPTLIPRGFQESEIGSVEARTVVKKMVPILADNVGKTRALLKHMNSKVMRPFVRDEKRLQWYTSLFKKSKQKEARDLRGFLKKGCFDGRPALKVHEARLLSLQANRDFKRAAMAVNVLDDNAPMYDVWMRQLDEAYEQMDEVLGLEGSMTPIDSQMRFQILLILSGIMVSWQK